MQEHRSTGARERVLGVAGTSCGSAAWRRVDGVTDGKLFARYPCAHTGWMVSQMASSLRIPVRAYRVDGVTDGKLFARYPCAHTGWMDNRWQTLCEVPQDRVDGQPMANALRGTRIQVWKSVDSQGLCARCLCTLSVHVVCARCLCTSSVHFICALHLCPSSVHVVCARRLCTSSVHFIYARCLCTLVDSCREGSHRATRRRHACHLASPSCHRDHIEYSCHRIQLP